MIKNLMVIIGGFFLSSAAFSQDMASLLKDANHKEIAHYQEQNMTISVEKSDMTSFEQNFGANIDEYIFSNFYLNFSKENYTSLLGNSEDFERSSTTTQYIDLPNKQKIIYLKSFIKKPKASFVQAVTLKNKDMYAVSCVSPLDNKPISLSTGPCAKAIKKYMGLNITSKDEMNAKDRIPDQELGPKELTGNMKMFTSGDFFLTYMAQDFSYMKKQTGRDPKKSIFSYDGFNMNVSNWKKNPQIAQNDPKFITSEYIKTAKNEEIITLRAFFNVTKMNTVTLMHFNNDLLEILFCTTMNPEKISLSSGTCANVIQTYLGVTITAEDEENALDHYPK